MLLILGLFACSDYNLFGKRNDEAHGGQTPTQEGPFLECPAVDLGPMLGVSGACENIEVGTFDPVVKFQFPLPQNHNPTSPLVAQLDGDANAEIAYCSYAASNDSQMQVIDGATGVEQWSVPGCDIWIHPALGDVDVDGVADVIFVERGSGYLRVKAHRGDGSKLWSVDLPDQIEGMVGAIALADLDANGTVEVVVAGLAILDGADGSLVATMDMWNDLGSDPYDYPWLFPLPADLDGDGMSELHFGSRALAMDGSELWSIDEPDGCTAMADFDGDGTGELVVAGLDFVRLQDGGGQVAWSVSLDGVDACPVVIEDFDDDGLPEIAFRQVDTAMPSQAWSGRLMVLDGDGSKLWATEKFESGLGWYGPTSQVTTWDFEGDGALDVVLNADWDGTFLYEGATGWEKPVWLDDKQVGFLDTQMSNWHGSPVVADIDGDGVGELLHTEVEGSSTLLVAYEDRLDSWMPARPVWNQMAYHVGNVSDDGTIPAGFTHDFETHNTFFVQPRQSRNDALVDLVPVVSDVCTVECDRGWIELVVRVGNTGDVQAGGRARLTVSARVDGAWVVVDEVEVDTAGLGLESDGQLFRLSTDEVGDGLLRIEVDADGVYAECIEDNNVVEVDLGCP